MIALVLPGGTDDAAEVIDALLSSADACEGNAPELAARRRALADQLGDALDTLPRPIHLEE
ncbi:hypothetical protein [Streptomyces sp. URMC 129]|uniref:hypothetical protein n=1 Tax=Streptomyces sp. URMC 129 TaxID=3423407 RepID=UPI003F1ACC8E